MTAADKLATSRLVGRNVRALRTMRNLNQGDLVNLLAGMGWTVDMSNLGRRENGTAPITVDELVLLAEALGATPAYLLVERTCQTCLDNPPSGFTCNACGAGGAR